MKAFVILLLLGVCVTCAICATTNRTVLEEGESLTTQQPPAPQKDAENPCFLSPITGVCKASIPSFFYNYTSGTCQEFVYGGCGGNENRFMEEEECMAACGGTTTLTNQTALEEGESLTTQQPPAPEKDAENRCFLSPITGMCMAYIPSFFYNHKTGTCQVFIYGGCGGNENRFMEEEECTAACGGITREQSITSQQQAASDKDAENPCLLSPITGLCLASIPSFFYNYTTGTCQEFIYGGCGGNKNRFMEEEECIAVCGGTINSSSLKDVPPGNDAESSIDSTSSNNTESTTTGESELSTEITMVGSETTIIPSESHESICKQPAVQGKCRASIPRFYFNNVSGNCEQFIYGGCDGNENNFISEDDCEMTCKSDVTK